MSSISIRKANLARLKTDVIVIGANEQLTVGTGVSATVFQEAGKEQLAAECAAIGGCKTGDAVMTGGGNLTARHIVHAVAPVWKDGKHKEPQQLYSCYRKALELAAASGAKSIGFPLLSAGGLRYPKDKAWRKALQACNDFLQEHPELDLEIVFAVRGDEMLQMGEKERDRQSRRIAKKKTAQAADSNSSGGSGGGTPDAPPEPVWCLDTAKTIDACVEGEQEDDGPVLDALLRDMKAGNQVLLPFTRNDGKVDDEDVSIFLHYLKGPDGEPWLSLFPSPDNLPDGDCRYINLPLTNAVRSLFQEENTCTGLFLTHAGNRFGMDLETARQLLDRYEASGPEDPGESSGTSAGASEEDLPAGTEPCLDSERAIHALHVSDSDNVQPVFDALFRDSRRGHIVYVPYCLDADLDLSRYEAGKTIDLREGEHFHFRYLEDQHGRWLPLFTSKSTLPKDAGSVLTISLKEILALASRREDLIGVTFNHVTEIFRLRQSDIHAVLEAVEDNTSEPDLCLDLENAIRAVRSSRSDDIRPVYDALLRDSLAGHAVYVPFLTDEERGEDGEETELSNGEHVRFYILEEHDNRWLPLFTSDNTLTENAGPVLPVPLKEILSVAARKETLAGVMFNFDTWILRLEHDDICMLLKLDRPRTQDEIDLDMGASAYQEGDFKTAVRLYRKAAAAGNVTAISNLGYCYYYGRSIPRDKKQARLCWEKASILGDAAATYKLGDMYRNGDLPRDIVYSRALYWRAMELAEPHKDPMVYPDACLRLLRHCSREMDPDRYLALARDAVAGFRARMEDGDPYTSKLYQESLAILQEVDDLP